jgi:hypothetical protein
MLLAGKLRAASAATDPLAAGHRARDVTSFIEAGTNVNEKPRSRGMTTNRRLCRGFLGRRRHVPLPSQSFCLASEDLLDRCFELGQLSKDVLLPELDIGEQL